MFLLQTCQNTSIKKQTAPKVKFEELEIAHGDHLLSNIIPFSKIIGKDSLVIYNGRIDRTFYLFNVSSKTTSKLLSFDEDGPNFIEETIQDFAVTDSAYFILSLNYIHIADKSGNIKKRIPTDLIRNNLDEPSAYRVRGIEVVSEDTLILSKKLISADLPGQVDNPKQSIFAYLTLSTDSIIDLPIYSPEETLVQDASQGYYSSLADHYAIINGKKILFNFRFAPSIYSANLTDYSVKQFEGRSVNFPDSRESFQAKDYTDYEKLLEYLFKGISFSNLSYDETNGYYYRIASNVSKDGNATTVERYLQIYDKEFEILKEIKLEKPVLPRMASHENQIYLILGNRHQLDENKIKLIRVTINE